MTAGLPPGRTMVDEDIKAILIDRSVLALTLYGEARNQPIEVRIAIGSVVQHRLTSPAVFNATAATWKAICLAPKQFSCWSPIGGPSNYAILMQKAEQIVLNVPTSDVILDECLWLAEGFLAGRVLDRANGATFYAETKLLAKSPDALGVSGLKVCAVAGALTFLKQ